MLPEEGSDLQIMSHAVVGYPSLEENQPAIDGLVRAGVKLIELQVPFSDPVADGATLVNACHQALQRGGSLATALDLAKQVCQRHPQVSFILMSYLNPLFRFGLEDLIGAAAEAGLKGMIIPDLPVENVEPLLPLCDDLGIAPILMVTPNTPEHRLERIGRAARGMLYVVARQGVTGKQSQWGEEFRCYLQRVRRYTDLPLAVGFGVRSEADLHALQGQAEVAAVCSKYIEWQTSLGSERAAAKLAELTAAI